MTSVKRTSKKIADKNVYSIAKLSKEFAETTSMHGLKFIAQERALLSERILWVILFILGLLFAIFFSWNLWENWKTSPVLITIQTANYPINNYPFPTVTICSVNKVSTRALENWMKTPEAQRFKLDEIRRILEIMSSNRVDNEDEVSYLSGLLRQANITSNHGRYELLMDALSPNCSEMIAYCLWEDKEQDCSTLFETEATDDGFCCSFNSIVIQRGDKTSKNRTLRKARTSGVKAGLTVLLDAEIDDYNVTSSAFNGFKVSIQDPRDFARTGRIGFLASPGFQIDAAVTGQTQRGDNKLKMIDRNKRLCVTDEEIKLKYFDDYTGPYCQLDCLIGLFFAECHCIPYYYPVRTELPVCSLSSYTCLQRITEHVLSNESACNCPDTCTTVWYQNEISSGTFPNSVSMYPLGLTRLRKFQGLDAQELNNYAKHNFAKLNVYFKTVSGLCYIMEERTNWTDFISAAGGLLGLGFGFSIISAAELFYFFLIRWCYYWYQSKKTTYPVNSTYPSVPSHYRENKSMKFRSHAKSIRPSMADNLPQAYKWWIPTNDEQENPKDYGNERPNLFQAWVDY